MKSYKTIYVSLFLSLFLFLFVKSVFAESQQGITVFPSIAHIDLVTDPPQYDLTYVNNTKFDVNLLLSVQDFDELEDSYKINFLEKKDAANYKYSLSSWITFENKNLSLSPGEQKSIKIFIDKDRITKGGHYASILAEIVQPQAKKQVNVKAILSSLLFVRASTGLEIENGKIDNLRPERDGIEFPNSFILRFENSGNVHVVPYGLVEVFDPFRSLIGKGILNENSLDALPESIRRYDISVKTDSGILWPGFYKAKLNMHFGKTNQKLNNEITFFSQGSFNFALIGFALIVVLGVLIYLWRRRKS